MSDTSRHPKYPDIRRGRLTDAEKARIDEIAGASKDPKPAFVARRLNRHPATVKWYMLTHGLYSKPPRRLRILKRVRADGVELHSWTQRQDDRLIDLRVEGRGYPECARILTAEFGIPRNPHSCRVRDVMLAAADDEEIAA
jgi:glycerophosphoryl diester phosphodiesterase